MNKKVKISIQGNEFLLPSSAIQKCTYENDTYVSMRQNMFFYNQTIC